MQAAHTECRRCGCNQATSRGAEGCTDACARRSLLQMGICQSAVGSHVAMHATSAAPVHATLLLQSQGIKTCGRPRKANPYSPLQAQLPNESTRIVCTSAHVGPPVQRLGDLATAPRHGAADHGARPQRHLAPVTSAPHCGTHTPPSQLRRAKDRGRTGTCKKMSGLQLAAAHPHMCTVMPHHAHHAPRGAPLAGPACWTRSTHACSACGRSPSNSQRLARSVEVPLPIPITRMGPRAICATRPRRRGRGT